jgi:GR25 family glycosyltransferase involved in LPS biosynthesis
MNTQHAIYVVNYCDEERRDRMAKRFHQMGLPVHFSDPVHAKDPRLYVEGQDMTGRTASIMLQHMDCLAHFLEHTQAAYCIVCEDDIMISKNLAKELPEISKTFDRLTLDVLLLGYLWPHDIASDWNPHFPHMGESRGSEGQRYEYTGYPDDLWGSQMYMVSRSHAQVLVKRYSPDYMVRELDEGETRQPYNPDWILTKKAERRAIIIPMLAVEEGDSKLGGDGEHAFHWSCREKNYVEGLHI